MKPRPTLQLPPTTARELEEVYVMRVTLEAEALRLSVPLLTSEDLARLDECIVAMDRSAEQGNNVGGAQAHCRFHQALTAPAGRWARRLLDQLSKETDRFDTADPGSSLAHREILEACRAGDRDLSAALLARHLAGGFLSAAACLEPGYDPARLRSVLADVGAAETPIAVAGGERRRRT